eukprot:Nk52_evm78s914 gene=Nk52_evmTU78s914
MISKECKVDVPFSFAKEKQAIQKEDSALTAKEFEYLLREQKRYEITLLVYFVILLATIAMLWGTITVITESHCNNEAFDAQNYFAKIDLKKILHGEKMGYKANSKTYEEVQYIGTANPHPMDIGLEEDYKLEDIEAVQDWLSQHEQKMEEDSELVVIEEKIENPET